MQCSHLENNFCPPLTSGVSKSKNTFGFRPSEWEERALVAAEEVTGKNRSDIIRRCVKQALGDVVQELLRDHESAIKSFNLVLKEETPPPKRKAG